MTETRGYALRNEIIQIGIVILDEDYKETDRICEFVKPEYGHVDAYIKHLTGISQYDVSKVGTLDRVWKTISERLPEDTVMVSWSYSDRAQLENEIDAKNLCFENIALLHENWIDCQKMFGEKAETDRAYRLEEALNMAEVDAEGENHNALDDAINTAKLFAKIQEPGFETSKCYIKAREEHEDFSFSLCTLFENLKMA